MTASSESKADHPDQDRDHDSDANEIADLLALREWASRRGRILRFCFRYDERSARLILGGRVHVPVDTHDHRSSAICCWRIT